jgi:hypothetical protein
MKRPPDKKVMLLVAAALLVAASAFASRPETAAVQKDAVFLKGH